MERITVLLADDHKIVREAYRNLLRLDPGLKLVAEACDGLKAVALAREFTPNVVLMDIAMPRLDGFGATRQVIKACPTSKVIILSVRYDDEYVKKALASGAAGFLPKHCTVQDLGQAIRKVHEGTSFCIFGSRSTLVRSLKPTECEPAIAGGKSKALEP